MKVKFNKVATAKIAALVDGFSTEVEWHGLVERTDYGFEVTDVIAFPHEASAGSVDSVQKEYEEWLDSLTDEQFNKLRFHGHSHVNMPTFVSGKDAKYQEDMLKGMPKGCTEDTFYIFGIFNKQRKYTIIVNDIENDETYDSNKGEVEVEFEKAKKIDTLDFLAEAKKLVRTRVYTVSAGKWDETDDYISALAYQLVFGSKPEAFDALDELLYTREVMEETR